MPTELEYTQFATRVYAADEKNRIGIPKGWQQLYWQPDIWDGFSAGAYGERVWGRPWGKGLGTPCNSLVHIYTERSGSNT